MQVRSVGVQANYAKSISMKGKPKSQIVEDSVVNLRRSMQCALEKGDFDVFECLAKVDRQITRVKLAEQKSPEVSWKRDFWEEPFKIHRDK